MNNIKKLFLAVFVVLISAANLSFAQVNNGIEKYSQVRISITSDNDIRKMQNSGLFLDGGIYKKGLYFETWLSASEIDMLRSSGVPFFVTVDDWLTYYSDRQKINQVPHNITLTDAYTIIHSIYGTMGGHLKWEEAIAKLDSMRLEYPSLVSTKWAIGTSYENRAMWTVRVTKNPDAPAGRPEVWLNGVTHAREPMGMMNLFYYIYWLLENYNIDPVATYILNNREIYFTPFINPDGYHYNQTTNPNGGGMWRKNRQPYGGYIGTDLNRNFGTYNFWNSPNGGSSTSPSSDTYRGPYPFSAKEDSVFKSFFNSRNFKTGLDYHTYGNYLLKPWYWNDPSPTPDDAVYNEMGGDIVADNDFSFGTSSQTLSYYIRGGDLDWCYSTDSTGHSSHGYFMLPEVGTSGFYATQSEIIPYSQMCMYMNIYMSLAAGPFTGLKNAALNKISYTQNETGNFKVVIRNKGLMDAANVKIQFIPLSSYVTIPVQVYSKTILPSRTSDSTTFSFTISGACPNNYGIPARLKILQNDTNTLYNKVLYIPVGSGTSLLIDSAENGFTNWTTSGTWAVTTAQYHSPSHSFTDSPTGNYTSNTNNIMTLNFPLNTSTSPVVFLSFWHKYNTEAVSDFCRVEVSDNNGANWTEVISYNGDMQTWTFQNFDITSFCNGSSNVRVRFRLTSDNALNYDGWYVDDIKITGYQGPLTGTGNLNSAPGKYSLEQNYPNPFNPRTIINYQLPTNNFVRIVVYDINGREMETLFNGMKAPGSYSIDFNGSSLSSGIYFYRIQAGDFTDVKKMIMIK
ncbi:MAG: T9SS type A sorting domain-containing protein [Ignavibacteria bacterium]|nr:T9SS type A sorting domain-containing protein [Ignavibacteria bacterium]